jgi:hypothetical protein
MTCGRMSSMVKTSSVGSPDVMMGLLLVTMNFSNTPDLDPVRHTCTDEMMR